MNYWKQRYSRYVRQETIDAMKALWLGADTSGFHPAILKAARQLLLCSHYAKGHEFDDLFDLLMHRGKVAT